jgi:cytochrome d ubiquinol oxidase subunit II
MILPWITAIVILVALIAYAILGGADFGGGVWDLLASGPRARRQRDLIAEAIAPVWEVNHVWLIVVIVLLFTCFPLAFSVISISLHVPLALMLLGIVLRAAAFVFRHYDAAAPDPVQRSWGQIFAWSSIITPLFLGAAVGAVSLGSIRVEDEVVLTGYFGPWLRPFPITVGVFTLVLFAFLAAVYLTKETRDPELQEDFRNRGLMAQLWVVVLAFLAGFANRADAAHVQVFRGVWPWVFVVLALVLAAAVSFALYRRRYTWARVLAASEVATIVVGWGAAMAPYMVAPDVTIQNAAAPPHVHLLILTVLFVGAFTLVPSLLWLYRLFKREPIFEELEEERRRA